MKSEHAIRLSMLLKELALLVEEMAVKTPEDLLGTEAPKPVAKKKKAAKKGEPAPEPVAAEPTPEPTHEPEPAPANTGNGAAPFHDGKGLLTYVSESFKLMGAEKGQKIGDILTELGVQSVTAVSPEMYGQFYQKVEELKNA